jgi:hypothetical protein
MTSGSSARDRSSRHDPRHHQHAAMTAASDAVCQRTASCGQAKEVEVNARTAIGTVRAVYQRGILATLRVSLVRGQCRTRHHGGQPAGCRGAPPPRAIDRQGALSQVRRRPLGMAGRRDAWGPVVPDRRRCTIAVRQPARPGRGPHPTGTSPAGGRLSRTPPGPAGPDPPAANARSYRRRPMAETPCGHGATPTGALPASGRVPRRGGRSGHEPRDRSRHARSPTRGHPVAGRGRVRGVHRRSGRPAGTAVALYTGDLAEGLAHDCFAAGGSGWRIT